MPDKNLTDEVRAALEAQAQGIPPAVLEQQKAVAEEWGTWVATQDIFFNGALAVPKGDSVPKANVEAYRYDELGWVEKRKAAESAEATTGKVK